MKEPIAIRLMHYEHGAKEGKRCGDCRYLVRLQAGRRTVYKCRIYGLTASATSDWRLKYDACGLCEEEVTDDGKG